MTPPVTLDGRRRPGLPALHILLLGALLCSLFAGGSAPAAPLRAQPILLELAAHQPEATLNLIVQKNTLAAEVEAAVARLGGVVVRPLRLINGFTAQLPASAVPDLARLPGVRWVSLDAAVHQSDAPPGVLREDFDLGVVADDDPSLWPGGWAWSDSPWLEIGEADGPVAGDIAVTSFLGGLRQGLRLQGAGKGLQGVVDLTYATQPTLSLAYRRKDLTPEDYVSIEISNDGGATWTEMARFAGPATDDELQTVGYDLATWATTPLILRLTTSPAFGTEARVYVDYIQIDYQPTFEQELVYEGALVHSVWLPLVTRNAGARVAGSDAAGGDTPEMAASYANSLFLRDYFSTNSYSRNDGTASWASNWTESDVAGAGVSAGNVTVYAGELWLDDAPDTGTEPSIRRKANLNGARYASLSFDFRTTFGVDPDDRIAVEVSANNGSSYTTLEIIDGINGLIWDSRTYDISEYAKKDTWIRFRVLENYGATNEAFIVDNVEIEYNTACVQCLNTANLIGNYVKTVGADKLWNVSPYRQGQGVTVAVVDSGIASHTDLNDQILWTRVKSWVDFSDSTYWDDVNGHGTYVAGVIGGNGTLSNGAYLGVAPRVNLLDVKVMDDFGSGSASNIVAGLEWVYNNKDYYNIRVVNLSLNSSVAESYHTSPLCAAVEILWFNGIVVVASAGNNGTATLYPPANDPFVITVGAVDDKNTASLSDDVVAAFSAHGVTGNTIAKPDLVAPGRNVVSLLASDDSQLSTVHWLNRVFGTFGWHYFRMSGTSVAAPVVSGGAALLLQDEPNLTPDQVKYRLMATANKSWAGYNAARAGAGTLDIYAAVTGTTTQSSNTGVAASQMLWTGSQPLAWGSASWNSASWNSASWNSASWNSASWNSASWNSDYWGP